MNIDGSAGTAMYRFGGDLAELEFLRYDVTNLAYRIRNHGRSAVIGVGGGRDMLSAHLFGFEDVTGVELNPIFIDWLTHRFRNYNHLADLPGTRFFVDEARSWFARTTERFDLIEMSLIDTWAATGAGAFSLSENGLYTVQGWQHFLERSDADRGVHGLALVQSAQHHRDRPAAQPCERRAARAWRRRSARRRSSWPARRTLATIIVANAPFSADDLSRLHKATSELGFTELVSPDRDVASPCCDGSLSAAARTIWRHSRNQYHIDLTAPTDDRPFFFNQLVLTDWASIRERAGNAEDGVIRGNLEATKTIGVIVLLSAILVLITMIFRACPRSAVRRHRLPGWARCISR